jgi:hypothetical protein
MRKATIYFLLVLCSATAFGQQQPQWKVVASVVLFNSDQTIPYGTTLYTPTEPGIYRVSVYLSTTGSSNRQSRDSYVLEVLGYDISGFQTIDVETGVVCSTPTFYSMPPLVLSLKPDVPLAYNLYAYLQSASYCYYNLIISVEQLVQ